MTVIHLKKKDIVKSSVKGVTVEFDHEKLTSILGIPGNNGICEYVKDVWEESKYIKLLEITRRFANNETLTAARRVQSTEMKPFQRFVHFIVMKNIVPRFEKRDTTSFIDLTYMDHLVNRRRINLPRVMMRHMAYVISVKDHELPYGQQSEVPIICFQCGQPGHTRRSCPSRFGAQDGAVSLPAQSSQSAPTLQAFRPAQPTHSAHSAHSVQVSGTGTKRAPVNDTLRGGPSTQLTQGRVYAIGGVSAPEVVADVETPGIIADASVARGEEPKRYDYFEETFLTMCKLRREDGVWWIGSGENRRRDDDVDAPEEEAEKEDEGNKDDFDWEVVIDEAAIEGESGSEEKFYDAEDKEQDSPAENEEISAAIPQSSAQ
ncbi:hypothetical protein Dimus_002583 [Dionaea muscipula]